MKTKVTILMLVLLGLGWYQTLDMVFGTPQQYEKHMEAAEKYAAKEIYEDALSEYEAALALKPESVEAKRKIANMHLLLQDKTSFISGCEELIYGEEMDEETLQMLVAYYDANGKDEEIVSMLKTLRNEYGENETVAKFWKQYRGSYEELYYSWEELAPFCNGYAVAGNEGKYGLINTSGNSAVAIRYDAMGYLSADNGCAPVNENGNWYYLNTKEHKKIVPDEPYDYLGTISEETAVVGKNGKFGFADTQMALKTECEWEAASNLYQGIAAVQKDGKWALVDSSFALQTDYIYEDVVMDASGFCSEQERVFVKQKDVYYLVDGTGERISDQVYQDAKPFAADGTAAVSIDGAWSYINADGEIILAGKFEDAGSFSQGAAPAKMDGKWGYIDAQGEWLIEPVFAEAYPLNGAGAAPVKQDYWFLIRLYALS